MRVKSKNHSRNLVSTLTEQKLRNCSTGDELLHDKTNKVTCAPSEDADQLGHSPSLVSLHCPPEEGLLLSYYSLSVQQRLSSDWEYESMLDAQVILLVLS